MSISEKNSDKRLHIVSKADETSQHLDPVTGLHAFPHYLPNLNKILNDQRALGMIFVDASELGKIEYDYGKEVYGKILCEVVSAIEDLKGNLIRKEDILSIRHPQDEVFLLFLSSHRPEYSNFLKIENLQNIIDRFVQLLNAKIFQITFPYTKRILKADIGYAYAVHNPLLSSERTIYRLIEQAKSVAKFNGDRFLQQVNESLKEIIMDENIVTHFQPIVDLEDGSIFAYEALSRGPKGSPMESPLMLFGIADKANLSFEVDRLCRRKAIQNVSGLAPHQKLFVNTFPTTMHDPEFKGEALQKLLKAAKLEGSNIVFEITERFAIENYGLFQKEQAYYSNLGFGLAVDDIGTGYGSLEAIANLKPEYVKVDISIIRNIDQSRVKQELLKAISDIGRKVNAKIIAEGIETQEELDIVRSFRCDFGQGYRLARPSSALLHPETKFKLIG
ncbi:MAG: EAL domain-containing protein [Deltaproteobacteria bacterium]|nr:EAL domain-containing protein [Deltaproteobacteria bacterium]